MDMRNKRSIVYLRPWNGSIGYDAFQIGGHEHPFYHHSTSAYEYDCERLRESSKLTKEQGTTGV
jgi:hypothetical protein